MSTSFTRWTTIAMVLALPATLVLLVLVYGLFAVDNDHTSHLRQFVLPEVVPNTLKLLFLVSTGAATIGVLCAMAVVFYEFPGRRFFQWLLLLPLAFPGYVLAFIYLGLLDYSGPIQRWLRHFFSIEIDILSACPLLGVSFVLTLALYPYVYLLARSGFSSQGCRALEVAASCQMTHRQAMFKAALPLSAPWIASGMLLVAMETLADFGAVAVFNYNTFTTAIYKAWFGLFSLTGALRLAAFLMLIVMLIVLIERHFSLQKNRSLASSGSVKRRQLSGGQAALAIISLSLLLILGVVLPTVQLLLWAFGDGVNEWNASFFSLLRNTLVFGIVGTFLVVATGLLLVSALRQNQHVLSRIVFRFAGFGYALPGTILAVSIYVVLSMFDRLWVQVFSSQIQLFLSASILATLLAYIVRFTTVAVGPIENGMLRVPPNLDNASRLMGVYGLNMLRTVHWPLLRVSILSAALLVFVDILKEMPITLMTRPFGWDTLAVRVFERTAEGQWAEAAPSALLIVLVGVLPIIFLTRKIEHAVAHR